MLTYAANGNTIPVIIIQEILIASLGLLAIPSYLPIGKVERKESTKVLPAGDGDRLEGNRNAILKLNNMSKTISQIAKGYKDVAATVVTEDEIKDNMSFVWKEKIKQNNENISNQLEEVSKVIEGMVRRN